MGPPSRTTPGVDEGDAASAVLAAIGVGVLALDPFGAAVYANPAWVELTGQDRAGWIGAGWRSLLPLGEERGQRFLDGLAEGAAPCIEVPVRTGLLARLLHLDVVRSAGSAAVVTARDVSEERAFEESLAHAAQRDPLTGLWNRSRFADFLAQALTRAERDHDRRAAVFFVDVDELKSTNDRSGHAAGDRLLQAVAACLTAAVRPGDVVARFGGDEFTVLCDDVEDGEVADIAGRILAAVDDSREATCTVSLGIALSLGATDDPGDIIARADADMYRSKRRSHQPAGGAASASDGTRAMALAEELAEVVWALGAFVRLLHDRWPSIPAADRAEVLDAVVRLQGRLEGALAAGGSDPAVRSRRPAGG